MLAGGSNQSKIFYHSLSPANLSPSFRESLLVSDGVRLLNLPTFVDYMDTGAEFNR